MADGTDLDHDDEVDAGPEQPTPEEAEFIRQGGKWADWRYKKSEARLKETRGRLDAERAARAALEARLAAVEGRVAEHDKPQAPTGPTLESLKKWQADYAALVHRVATDAEDADARTKLAEVKPEHVVAVNSAIAEMMANGAAGKIKTEVEATRAADRRQVALQRKLAEEYGNDVLDFNSDLMQRAKEEFAALAAEHGGDDENGALTRLAVERAYRAVNRGGRGSDKDRRRLAVEEGSRREASPLNSIAALMQKGDPKSQRKAAEIGLGEALKQWGMAS